MEFVVQFYHPNTRGMMITGQEHEKIKIVIMRKSLENMLFEESEGSVIMTEEGGRRRGGVRGKEEDKKN